ncbi:hypothetical protein [Nannocystis pusilla]|uniref:hypothetical protein n=1 Tax=Nannocystis pusilla TaxID=889268 RepID=UPI003B7B1365
MVAAPAKVVEAMSAHGIVRAPPVSWMMTSRSWWSSRMVPRRTLPSRRITVS